MKDLSKSNPSEEVNVSLPQCPGCGTPGGYKPNRDVPTFLYPCGREECDDGSGAMYLGACSIIAGLRRERDELRAAYREADEHIRLLQSAFQDLARGASVPGPDTYTQTERLHRLATWWHGEGLREEPGDA